MNNQPYYNSSKNFIYNLFTKRFGNPEGNESYYNQWVNRDKKGIERLLGKMDFSTRRVFIKCLLNIEGFLPSDSIYMKFGKFLVNPSLKNFETLHNAMMKYIKSNK